MNSSIKHILKKYLKFYKVRHRFSPNLFQRQQMLSSFYYENRGTDDLPYIADTGLKVFSQFEEDGKLLFIFSVLGMTNKTFIEFGADDGHVAVAVHDELGFATVYQKLFAHMNCHRVTNGCIFVGADLLGPRKANCIADELFDDGVHNA